VILLFTFAGPTTVLVGIGAAVSLVLLGLYLLREQHRPLLVPFVELWRRTLEKRRSSVPWHRLRRILSLLLQLLLLGLLLFALADPRPDAAKDAGRTVVLIVDVSPSMEAPVGARGGPTRLDEAKRVLNRWVDAVGSHDRVLLISAAARARVETPWTNDSKRLRAAISRLSYQHSAADVPRALRLARDSRPRDAKTEVVLVSDGALPPLDRTDTEGLDLTFEPVASSSGVAAENIGISNFSARRYADEPRRFEAQIELSSTAAQSAEVEVTLLAVNASYERAAVIEVERAIVPAAGRRVIPLPRLGGAKSGVIAEIRRVDGGQDWLEADNRAVLLLAALPPLRVLYVGPPNQFVDAALLTEPDIVTTRVEAEAPRSESTYDIAIYATGQHTTHSAKAAIYLGPPEGDEPYPVARGRALSMFGFDRWQKESPIFAAVDPYDVQVLSGRALRPGPGDQALAFAGGEPIVVMGERAEGRFLALGFDPKQSDFFLRAAWPLFLHNSLWELAPRVSGEDGVAFAPGRDWHLRTPTLDPSAVVRGPLGTADVATFRVAVTEQRTTFFGDLAGFYEIEQGQERSTFFANYFDESEARLLPAKDLRRGPTAAALTRPRPFEKRADHAPWMLLIACALLLSFSEWWSYHRRWTV